MGNGSWAMVCLERRVEMGAINSYRDLVAWQRARELVREVYLMTEYFPDEEKYGLRSQLRRSGISVASNIAEGYGRGSGPDYLRFLRIARGSLFEIETQLILSSDLGLLTQETHDEMQALVDNVGRPLSGLIRSLERKT